MAYERFRSSAENKFYQSETVAAVKWACFSVALVAAYILICAPFLSQLKDEIWLTEGMINLIPTKLLMENAELKKSIFQQQL